MEQREDAGPLISRDDLSKLAGLLDRFENALDPDSREAKEAESDFNNELDAIYTFVVQTNFPQIKFGAFRAHVRMKCLRMLAKEREKPPALQ
jgi:hypothetical protein